MQPEGSRCSGQQDQSCYLPGIEVRIGKESQKHTNRRQCNADEKLSINRSFSAFNEVFKLAHGLSDVLGAIPRGNTSQGILIAISKNAFLLAYAVDVPPMNQAGKRARLCSTHSRDQGALGVNDEPALASIVAIKVSEAIGRPARLRVSSYKTKLTLSLLHKSLLHIEFRLFHLLSLP